MTTYRAKARQFFTSAMDGMSQLGDSIEFRAVWPVIAAWFGIFLVVSAIQNHSYGWRELFQITVSSTGLAMAAAWTVFYRESSARRLMIYAGLVLAMTIFGVSLGTQRGNFGEMTSITLMTATVCPIPLWLTKRFLGWRILHPLDQPVPVSNGRQFSIYEILGWTTCAAVLVVIVNQVGIRVFNGQLLRVLFFLSVGVFVPSAIGLVYFSIVARLNTVQLIFATPVYSFVVAGFICLLLSAIDGRNLWRDLFWLNLIWFSIAGWGITVAVWWLRQRGFVFAFGRPQVTVSAADYYEGQIKRIDRRITNLEIRKGKIEQERSRLSS